MRRLAAPLLIFLVILTPLVAYSVYMPVVAVDPLGKPEMVYRFEKNNNAEVRSVSLTTSGTTVTSATVGFYVWFGARYIVSVVLRDPGGNVISTGSTCRFFGAGLRSIAIPLSPQVSIDSVYTVEASATRVFSCI
jgi:hypothetical protein